MMQHVERKDTSPVTVRRLKPEDITAVIDLDARITGRKRTEYFKLKLQQALQESGIKVSLAAEIDHCFAGFLLARVFYGEFGIQEPVAVLDTIGVHPDFQRLGVARALLDQLVTNLRGLSVDRLQTEVSWSEPRLLAFFQHEGFTMADRICLDLDLGEAEERRRGR